LEGLSIPEFMNREVRHADKILIYGSPKYKRNVQLMGWPSYQLRMGGDAVTSAIWTSQKSRTQFEVVILKGNPDEALPLFLSGWPYIDLTHDYRRNHVALLRRLTGNQEVAPPIGQVPDFHLEGSRGGIVWSEPQN
jgi:hypothetical protein